MLSRFNHTIRLSDDLYAVYNSLIFEPVFVDHGELNNIINGSVTDEVRSTLLKKGIYILADEADILAEDRTRKEIHSHVRKVKILYLIVSTGCNLACRYCFIENNPLSTCNYSIMSKETAKIAIDKFFAQADLKEQVDVIFYGGEPLTHWETVKFSISYIRAEYGNDINISIVSNGTLVNQSIACFLAKENVGIGISIDGPKIINDSNRIFRNKKDSVYDAVLDGIKLLKANHCKIGLSITVTREVLDNKDLVLEWIGQLGVASVFWNLFHFSSSLVDWETYYEKMAEFILDSHEVLEASGVTDARMQDLLELFSKSIFRYESCGALGLNQITITPNGDVCVCQGDSRDNSKVAGNIISNSIDDIINSELASKWENLLTIDRNECLECPALFVCGGGCPAHAEVLFGNRHCIDKPACIFYKKYLSWVLKKYYEMEVTQNDRYS